MRTALVVLVSVLGVVPLSGHASKPGLIILPAPAGATALSPTGTQTGAAAMVRRVADRATADVQTGVAAPDPAAGQAIQKVIAHQIEAFRHDDAAAAFSDAAPGIQAMFGTPSRFLAMVQHGYPPVYRPRSVAFGALLSLGGRLVQKVDLVGPDGQSVLALYTMEREPDGKWRIEGCALTASDDVGA